MLDMKKRFIKKSYPDNYLDNNNLPDLYVLEIDANELSELYKINYIAIYRDHHFEIVATEGYLYLVIGTTNVNLAKELRFIRTDKYYYEKRIPKNEVKIIEERENLSIE